MIHLGHVYRHHVTILNHKIILRTTYHLHQNSKSVIAVPTRTCLQIKTPTCVTRGLPAIVMKKLPCTHFVCKFEGSSCPLHFIFSISFIPPNNTNITPLCNKQEWSNNAYIVGFRQEPMKTTFLTKLWSWLSGMYSCTKGLQIFYSTLPMIFKEPHFVDTYCKST